MHCFRFSIFDRVVPLTHARNTRTDRTRRPRAGGNATFGFNPSSLKSSFFRTRIGDQLVRKAGDLSIFGARLGPLFAWHELV